MTDNDDDGDDDDDEGSDDDWEIMIRMTMPDCCDG